MNSSDQQRALLEARSRNIESTALATRHQSLEKALKTAMAKVQTDETLQPLAEEIFTRVIHKVIGQYQTKVNAGMQDSLNDLLSAFRQKVLSNIFEVSDTWKVRNHDTCLFPVGCRYLYTRGQSIVAVIEQQPQTRTLSFQEGLQEEYSRGTYGTERILLAFPYVYFIMHFRETERITLTGVYSAWRTTAINSLTDTVSKPILPNTHANCMICMGHRPIHGENIAAMSAAAISDYWNSRFTNDLSDFWWGKRTLNHHLSTGRSWSRTSLENSAFILSVPFPPSYTVQQLINLLVSQEVAPGELDLRNKITAALDKCVETLFAKILRYFKHTKFDHLYPKGSTTQVSQALDSVVKEMSDVLLALEHEINKLGESIKDIQPSFHWKKRGDLWQDSY
jgi:hypothetical protein